VDLPYPRRFEQSPSQLGYSLDVAQHYRSVCPSCIADDALRRFVGGNGPIEHCGFCGGDGPQGIRLGSLFNYMGARIGTEWVPAIDEFPVDDDEEAWETGGAAVDDAAELLAALDEPLANEELRAAFVAAFVDHWISRHALRWPHHQRLSYGWGAFARYVKEEARFLFLRTGGGPQGNEELIPPAQLLDEVAMAIENSGLIRRLPAGTQLFRGRRHPPQDTLLTSEGLGSPPRERATSNRMSPAGVSMFYGAEDSQTVVAELRREGLPSAATVGTWSTARRLHYLDLVDVVVPSVFDMVGKSYRPWLLFLRDFAAEVCRPSTPEGAAVDYVPTQVFTEYVRHLLGDCDDPVRGIRYRSAVRPEGVCWVLFVDARGCTELAPGWQDDPSCWLGLDPSLLRRFGATPSWAEQR
jgi:hypothetical protein